MLCPKCGSTMHPVDASYGETVERCGHCKGLFSSERALALMQRHWFHWPRGGVERIDSGDPAVGREYDAITHVDCPGCGTHMSHVAHPEQTHIALERCPGCHGVFFDAGELTDLRYKTFADWVRDRFSSTARPG